MDEDPLEALKKLVPGRELVTRPGAAVELARRKQARRALRSPQMRDALESVLDYVKKEAGDDGED